MHVVWRHLLRAVVFCVGASLAWAEPSLQVMQANRELSGSVQDAMQAAVVGARVTAVSVSQQAEVSAVTDGQGQFTLKLFPGRYVVLVSAPGFAVLERELDLSTASATATTFTVQVAGVTESVRVTAPEGYRIAATRSATKTPTLLRDIPQAITVVTRELVRDQMMQGVGDAMRYVPGVMVHQGENNRDQVILRGNSSSADFFLDGVRDDVQYYRDLYNLDRVETLKGPNAMVFGRGGAGGVVNRVGRVASFRPVREFTMQTGSFGRKRLSGGASQALGTKVAVRVDALAEDAESFRSQVDARRYGVTPTMTVVPDAHTTVTLRYEFLNDRRTADRGIPSFAGRPVEVAPSTFYGNPADSHVRANVHLTSGTVERRLGRVTLRNQTLMGVYARAYQNYVPGVVNATQTQVALTAYGNETSRTNLFNQTDLTLVGHTGRVRHTVLTGAEVGRQSTDNLRKTGYFGNTATSMQLPFQSTVTAVPVTYRQSATDAANHLIARVAAVYAQDQAELSSRVQLVAGLRVDRFTLDYENRRTGDQLSRPDTLVSPRLGLVIKPSETMSLYGSLGVSFVPSSGDQFSSLTNVTEQMKPERLHNYELGAKWDVRTGLALTGAIYRLDRTNTRAVDPVDPTRIVQTGSQRSTGFEAGANGRLTRQWTLAGGYAYQEASIVSATAAAVAGARVPQVPRHMFSLWNNYQVTPRIGAALGLVQRSEVFAAIDNTVRLPGYLRADVAGFLALTQSLRLQVNVENLFNTRYFSNADGNTNISPGSPRGARLGLVATF